MKTIRSITARRVCLLLTVLLMLISLTSCGKTDHTVSKIGSSENIYSSWYMEMKYLHFGQGTTPLVILPGLSLHDVSDSGEAVSAAFADMAADFDIWLFDQPVQVPDGYTVSDMAGFIAHAMDELGIQNACVFGASLGGMMGQMLAIQRPDLVAKLVAASSASRLDEGAREMFDRWIALAEAERGSELAEDMTRHIYSESTFAAYGEGIIAANAQFSLQEKERFIILCRACRDFDCTDQLPAIRCPVLVIGSEGDQALRPQASQELAEKLGCECYLYGSEYGHAVYDEAPDYHQRLLDFFKQ